MKNLATMPTASQRTVKQSVIGLANGYKILLRRESISKVGRSIFRDFDSEQVVIEIVDQKGKVTKRLPIPSRASHEVAEFLGV